MALNDYFGSRVGRAFVNGTLLGACVLSIPGPARAQDDAADKANARSLATEGIELYNEGRYAEALDRLERAQALFDAPMHLLYIARAQVKLGQLVEASETYRRLIRVELSQDTPSAVREAVESADAELDGVEARVSALRIEIVPANEPGLVVTIDDKPVSPAAIGVDRPVNPGRHRVRASVPDGRNVEKTIELPDGGRKALRLELTKTTQPVTPAPSTTPTAERTRTSPWALFAGAGLGAGLPVGKVSTGPDAPAGDYASIGMSLELKLGLRFAHYFGVKLFGEGALHAPGSPPVNVSRLPGRASDRAKVDAGVVNRQVVGVSFLAGSRHGKLGGYGELGVAYERFALGIDITLPEGQCGTSTSQSLTLTGPSLRVGGGAVVPVSRSFQLVPYAHGTLGRYRHATSSTCGAIPPPAYLQGDIDGERVATHAWITLGVSGEFDLYSR